MIDNLLSPSSIAVVGASHEYQKNGGRVLINLIKSRFSGSIYAVNPNHEDVLGMPCFSSLIEIPNEVDLACILVPMPDIPDVLRNCIEKGVKMAVIFSSVFIETSAEGQVIQEEIQSVIKGSSLRIMGPYVPNFFNFRDRWALSFSSQFDPHRLLHGSVGVITQGLNLGRAVIDVNEKGIGFSYLVCPGWEMDLDTNDFLEWMINQEDTQVILLVLASNPDPNRFLGLLHAAREKVKPIVLLKIGQSTRSMEIMARSEPDDRKPCVSSSLYKHPAIIEADDLDELVQLGWLLNTFKEVYQGRTIIFSWGVDISFFLVDLCEKYGIYLPALSQWLQEQLSSAGSGSNRLMNPLDLFEGVYQTPALFYEGIQSIIDSGEYDIILMPIPFRVDVLTEDMAHLLIETAKANPGIVLLPIFMSTGECKGIAYEMIRESGIPYFTRAETAIKTLSLFLRYKIYNNNY